MTNVEYLARRTRLFRPHNGRASTELEIVPEHRFARTKFQPLAKPRFLLCDADQEALIPTIDSIEYAQSLRRRSFVEPPVLDQKDLPPVSIRDIARTVAGFYGVRVVDIVSHRRTANLTWPRHVTYYLCREMTTRSLPYIGSHLGGKDHTTCLSGIRKIERFIAVDRELADEIEYLKDIIRSVP